MLGFPHDRGQKIDMSGDAVPRIAAFAYLVHFGFLAVARLWPESGISM